MDEPCVSEVGAGKGRIKAEKTSDDGEKPGTPVRDPCWGNAAREQQEKMVLLPLLLRGPEMDLGISLSLFFHKMGKLIDPPLQHCSSDKMTFCVESA